MDAAIARETPSVSVPNPKIQSENRRDRRLAVNQTGKRRVVVIAREKNGKTLRV
jgi:hypothetical protein